MARTVSPASGKLSKLFTNTLALKIRTAVVQRSLAFLLVIALFFSGILFTLPRNVKAGPQTEGAPISAPPEPFVIHSPVAESTIIPTIANFFSGVAAFFRTPSRPEGLTGNRVGVTQAPIDNSVRSQTVGSTMLTLSTAPVSFDFDGDGKADYARWHSANEDFKVKKSGSSGYDSYTLGTSTSARVAPGKFTSSGSTDAAIFDAGTWTYKTSPSGSSSTISWGQSGDIPVPGDYDGDGVTDAAVFRPSNNTWYVLKSSGGNYGIAFGSSGDIPVPGDYDGDGKSDLAVFRPSTGYWYVQGSTVGFYGIQWGLGSDIPVPADYDGDTKTDCAVFRPSTGTWYILKSSSTTGEYISQAWGNWGDQPTPADYDGDGKADLSVWRPTTGQWWTLKTNGTGYENVSLGVNGDFAVESAFLKQSGANVESDDLAAARLSPKNATGGTDLYSQNFSWSTGLVSLPGRAGLDLNLGISYNSLIWTKVGDAIVFDPDDSNVTPGFRLGFPTIEPVYYDGTKQKYAYMMVTPSGSRVEFRQTTVSNVYETADSSYTQLVTTGASDPNDPVENITIKVTSTDGTQMTYAWGYGEFRCVEIKDRNGNYISATYDGVSRIDTITDTLGRVLTINYNTDGLPSSITQTWKDANGSGSETVHTWASFSYTDTDGGTGHAPAINTSFSETSTVGPPNGVSIKVLQKITYPDNSFTKFAYNNYAQVVEVQNYAPDSHELNHVLLYDMQSVSGPQSDCPRYSVTRSYAENFNNNAEVEITNNRSSVTNHSLSTGISVSGTQIDTVMTNEPNQLFSRTFYGSSGWNEGLPLGTEDCVGAWSSTTCPDRKRWTWTNWTQDDTGLSYTLNPRVTESRVGDSTNVKRTTIDYRYDSGTNSYLYGLPETVKVYASDLSTVIKKAVTTYNLSSTYTSRRIIGLPSQTEGWGWNDLSYSLEYTSKTTYGYDEENFTYESNQNISSVTRHDNTNYSSSLVAGRGNLTTVTRVDPTSTLSSISTKRRYDIAGSVVASLDPLNRKVAIDYTDNFNDSTNRYSYAYPKTITDPASNVSTIKYRYDIGANVWAQSPNVNSSTAGKETSREFDALGRLSKETIVNNGAYTRYEYPTNGIQSKVYSTIIDTGTAGVGSEDETLTESWFDGAGRVRQSRAEHPNSTGGWAATKTEYDILGRAIRSTVPTEVTVSNANDPSSWTPSGDDSRVDANNNSVWLWNAQEFDWKGRVTRAIPSDSNGIDGKDTTFSYDGCGCAGGQVKTISGENIIETDWQGNNANTLGRRTQKIYEDTLGRAFKTETYTWDGTTVSSTNVDYFNGRDQVETTRQYAGNTSAAYRDVVMSYDGFGRMATRHYPIEDTGTQTGWTYNVDDTINKITDPRGVVTNFSYYSTTGLLHTIGYDVPSGLISTVPNPGTITFGYDNVGNRTSMLDGTGSTSYAYNSLSQMTSETKNINGLTGSFTINYTYNLSGQLLTMSNPQDSNEVATYGFDKVGRATEVVRRTSGIVSGSIHDTTFRAWGALKEYRLTTGSGTDFNFVRFGYDDRQNISGFGTGTSGGSFSWSWNYQRYNDGLVKKVYNVSTDTSFDRSIKYDNVGRVTQGLSGHEANGNSSVTDTPFRNNFSYNAFNDITSVTGQHWGRTVKPYNGPTGTSPRLSTSSYDSAGNTTSEQISSIPSVYQSSTYDASGRNVKTIDPLIHSCCENNHTYDMEFDGNGWQVARIDTSTPPSQPSFTDTTYDFRSTVLGGERVGELKIHSWTSGQDKRFITPINGRKWGDEIEWTAPEGIATFGSDGGTLDLRGSDVGEENPYNSTDGSTNYPDSGGDPTNYTRCTWEGMPMSCGQAFRIASWQHPTGGQWKELGVDSPLDLPRDPQTGTNPSGLSLAASTKPKADPHKGQVVEPALIPDNGTNPESPGNRASRRWNVTVNASESAEMIEARGYELLDSPLNFRPPPPMPKPSDKEIRKATTDCLNELWGTNRMRFDVTYISPAVSGKSNGFIEVEKQTYSGGGWLPGAWSHSTMTFTSDAQLYSGKELAAMKKDRGDWLAGLTPFAPGTTKTYIANDIPSTRGAYMFSGLDQKIGIVLAAQIHEFGVAMSANFGQRDPPDKYLHPENKRLFDPDSGMALEDCVKNKLK